MPVRLSSETMRLNGRRCHGIADLRGANPRNSSTVPLGRRAMGGVIGVARPERAVVGQGGDQAVTARITSGSTTPVSF